MSSASHGPPPAGLLVETSLADLEVAWKERDAEAQQLMVHGYHSTALSLRIYSLEIRIKTLICKHLRLSHLPKVCKTHDIKELVIFTGLSSELQDPANAAVRQNWDLLADFSKVRLNDQRYLPRGLLDPLELKKHNDALDDPQDGVLAWLSRHP
jgi:hypothetical protein